MRESGYLISRVTVNSLPLKSNRTPNLYFGMQENSNLPYHGLDPDNPEHCPLMRDLASVQFQYRASLSTGSPKENVSFGRVMTYYNWFDRKKRKGGMVAIDLLTFESGIRSAALVTARRPVARESDLAGIEPGHPRYEALYNTVYIYAPAASFVTLTGLAEFVRDPSLDGSGTLDSQPFTKVTVDVQQMIEFLHDNAYFDHTDVRASQYIGGIVNGVEIWGRSKVSLDVKDRTFWVRR